MSSQGISPTRRRIQLRFDFTSLQGVLTWTFIIIAISVVGVIYFIFAFWNSALQENRNLYQVTQRILKESDQLLDQVKRTQQNLTTYILLNEQQYVNDNRKIWLVGIPATKDSLYHFISQTNNNDAKVVYISLGKQLAELQQTEEQAIIAFESIRDKDLLRKLLKIDIITTVKNIEKSIADLNQLERKRVENIEKAFLAKQNNFLYLIILIGFVLILITYGIGLFLGVNILNGNITIRNFLEQISRGHLPDDLDRRQDEFAGIARASNQVKASLIAIQNYAVAVSRGNFDTNLIHYEPGSEMGEILLDMGRNLQAVYDEDRQQGWSIQGLAKFADIIRRSSDSIEHLCQQVIIDLTKHLESIQGGFFVLNQDDPAKPYLALIASYAYGREKFIQKQVDLEEGLVGRAFQEKEIILLNDVPTSYLQIGTALGYASPNYLLILPLLFEGRTIGIIELASFKQYEPFEIDFLQKLSETLASAIISVITSQKNRALLDEAQKMTDMLKNQERELKSNALELLDAQEEIEKRYKTAQKEQQKLNTILNNITEGIVVTNEKGEIMLYNYTAEQIFAYKEAEILQQRITNLIPTYNLRASVEVPSLQQDNMKVLKTQEVFEAIDKYKYRFPVYISLTELIIEDERLYCCMVKKI